MEKQQIHLRVPVDAESRRELKKLAADYDVSLAELVRQLIQEGLAYRGITLNPGSNLASWGGDRRKEDE